MKALILMIPALSLTLAGCEQKPAVGPQGPPGPPGPQGQQGLLVLLGRRASLVQMDRPVLQDRKENPGHQAISCA
jgi:hypothetical protein